MKKLTKKIVAIIAACLMVATTVASLPVFAATHTMNRTSMTTPKIIAYIPTHYASTPNGMITCSNAVVKSTVATYKCTVCTAQLTLTHTYNDQHANGCGGNTNPLPPLTQTHVY